MKDSHGTLIAGLRVVLQRELQTTCELGALLVFIGDEGLVVHASLSCLKLSRLISRLVFSIARCMLVLMMSAGIILQDLYSYLTNYLFCENVRLTHLNFPGN
jgi:hypothetical protein